MRLEVLEEPGRPAPHLLRVDGERLWVVRVGGAWWQKVVVYPAFGPAPGQVHVACD